MTVSNMSFHLVTLNEDLLHDQLELLERKDVAVVLSRASANRNQEMFFELTSKF